MKNNNLEKNKFITYLLIASGILILFFFTKSYIYDLQETKDSIKETKSIVLQKEDELKKLTKTQEELKNLKGTLAKTISKIDRKFVENELFDYIYSYANKKGNDVEITNISLSKGGLNEMGFNEGTINVNASFSNEQSYLNFIRFILSDSSKYKFYIDSASYPFGNANKTFKASIPLKVLYK